MASGEKQAVGPSVDNCIVDLGVCTTRLKVYITALGTYDLIIGMDWLAAHRALVDCFAKRVFCVDDEGRPIEIQGTEKSVITLYINYEGQAMLDTRVSTLCSGGSERKEGTLVGSVPSIVRISGCFPYKLP